MPTAVIDGIVTRYELVGSGPPLRQPTRACSNFCAGSDCDVQESCGLGRDVSRFLIAVIRTIALRLFARVRFWGALPFGRAAPITQANDIIGIGGLRFRDRFGHGPASTRPFEGLALDREFGGPFCCASCEPRDRPIADSGSSQ